MEAINVTLTIQLGWELFCKVLNLGVRYEWRGHSRKGREGEREGGEGALIDWCITFNEETGGEGERGRGRGYARLTQTKTNRRNGVGSV